MFRIASLISFVCSVAFCAQPLVGQQAAAAPVSTPVTAPGAAKPELLEIIPAIHGAGRLVCGTVQPIDDWDGRGEHGDLSTLGQALCEAVAVAVLGPKAPVEVRPFPAESEALQALQAKQVHLVVGLSPSVEAGTQYGVTFSRPVFYDTQRFLVAAAAKFQHITDLRGDLICAMNNTPSEARLHDYMAEKKIAYGLQAHSEQGEMDASVAVAHCAAGSALESRLAQSRADFPANAPEFVFLPERFGLEPVVAGFHSGDERFARLVDMTISALVEAEALGITQANVNEAKKRTDLEARRLLGADRTVGQALGLPADWAVPVLAAVGNYGEMYTRTVGKAYHLERGPNALWLAGGLMSPSPMQ
jgi:general L-amino acid transport system substrate-binding protein